MRAVALQSIGTYDLIIPISEALLLSLLRLLSKVHQKVALSSCTSLSSIRVWPT